MSISIVINRIVSRWWLVLVFLIILFSTLSPFVSQNSYSANISLGAKFNSDEFIQTNDQNSQQYTESLSAFSSYLSNRFSSIDVQSYIADELKLRDITFEQKNPFYNVTSQQGGFVSLNYRTDQKSKAEDFLEAVKNVYQELLEVEMQENTLPAFQVEPQTNFIESVTEVSTPTQLRILPILAGVFLGIFVAAIWPLKSEKDTA